MKLSYVPIYMVEQQEGFEECEELLEIYFSNGILEPMEYDPLEGYVSIWDYFWEDLG